MPNQRNILWVTPKWPLPTTDGAKQAIVALLSSSTRLGESVDLLCFVDQAVTAHEIESARETLGVKKIFIAIKPMPLGRFTRLLNAIYSIAAISHLPFTIIPYYSKKLLHVLNCEQAMPPWTHILLDGLHPAASFIFEGKRTLLKETKLIYRAHNLEANLWLKMAEQSGVIAKYLLLNQAKKVSKLESELLDNCSALAPVSQQDLTQFNSSYSQVPAAKVVPIGFDFSVIPGSQSQDSITSELKLLFVGSTAWKPNKSGLEWFLREVWPLVCSSRADISLTIVGKGNENLAHNFSVLSRVTFLGQVENLDNLYRESSASIVPIFTGSGTRVKAIEAARFAKACISTKIGVEGLPLVNKNSYLQAESAHDWVQILSKISAAELIKLGHQAHENLKRDFDKIASAKVLIELLDQI